MIVRKLKTAAFVFMAFTVLMIAAKKLEKEDYTQLFENSSPQSQKTEKVITALPTTHKEPAQKENQKRMIKVVNHMDDKKSLTYNHSTGNYKPKEFKLLVNNTENAHIERKKDFIKHTEQEIEIVNNTVYIEYNFKFSEYWGTYTRGG